MFIESLRMSLAKPQFCKFSQILLNINEDITEGNSLSSAMKKYPSIFDEIYTSTIYAGETSASLSEVFFVSII